MKIEKFWSWIIVATIFGMCLQGCASDEPGKITYGKRLPVGTTVVPANYYEGQYAPMPLPSTLKKIEKESFYACKNEYIVVPEGVTEIYENAFARGSDGHSFGGVEGEYNVGNLATLLLPSTVKYIGEKAYSGYFHGGMSTAIYGTPKVIIEAVTPPTGVFNGFGSVGEVESRVKGSPFLYVPEEGYDLYIQARDKYLNLSNMHDEESIEIRKGLVRVIPFKKLSINITEEKDGINRKFVVIPNSDNKAEIVSVSWETTDSSIATVSPSGTLEVKKSDKTVNIVCMPLIMLEDGKKLKFYRFKEITT